jgi:hypothetical protein
MTRKSDDLWFEIVLDAHCHPLNTG